MEKGIDQMIGISSRIPYGAQLALLELAALHGATKTVGSDRQPCLTTLLRMLASGAIGTVKQFEIARIKNPYPYSKGKKKNGN